MPSRLAITSLAERVFAPQEQYVYSSSLPKQRGAPPERNVDTSNISLLTERTICVVDGYKRNMKGVPL
jgi:hypothetical protein